MFGNRWAALIIGLCFMLVGGADCSSFSAETHKDNNGAFQSACDPFTGTTSTSWADARPKAVTLKDPKAPAQWRVDLGAGISAPPAIVGDCIYLGTGDHRLVAVGAASGFHRWFDLAGGPIVGAPLLRYGTLVFSEAHPGGGATYGASARHGNPIWYFPSIGRPSAGVLLGGRYFNRDDTGITALDALTGKVRWKTRIVQPGTFRNVMTGAGWAIALTQGAPNRLFLLSGASGRQMWSKTFPAEERGFDAIAPAIDGSKVIVASYAPTVQGNYRQVIREFSLATGRLDWLVYGGGGRLPKLLRSGLLVNNDTIYATDDAMASMTAIDERTGSLKWRVQLKGPSELPMLWRGKLVTVSAPGWVQVIDDGGSTVSLSRFSRSPWQSAGVAIYGDSLITADARGSLSAVPLNVPRGNAVDHR